MPEGSWKTKPVFHPDAPGRRRTPYKHDEGVFHFPEQRPRNKPAIVTAACSDTLNTTRSKGKRHKEMKNTPAKCHRAKADIIFTLRYTEWRLTAHDTSSRMSASCSEPCVRCVCGAFFYLQTVWGAFSWILSFNVRTCFIAKQFTRQIMKISFRLGWGWINIDFYLWCVLNFHL